MQTILSLFCFYILLYILQKVLAFRKATRAIQNHPGYRVLFSPTSWVGTILPKVRGVAVGGNHLFDNKHKTFSAAGWDILVSISAFPKIQTIVYLADVDAIKEVTSSRERFPKPIHLYDALSFYGHNIIASEGDEWKKYRRITQPAFTERNNQLVWDSTTDIVEGLFRDVWADQDVITVDQSVDITLPIALFVIGAASFGRSISWKEDDVVPPGHTLSFKNALHVTTSEFILRLIVPDKAMGLTKRTRAMRTAFEELHRYMVEMIHERQSGEKVERHDLLGNLLAANDENTGSNVLTEDEIIANIYIFLVGGHETTAQTLSFTFAMLALYTEEQDKLFEHIKSVLPDGQKPTYKQMARLTYAMAVFNEILRMFPPATAVHKIAAEDTTLSTTNIHGEKCTIPIAKGDDIAISVPGLHYNPRYWEDPYTFKPSRFLGDWPRDAFFTFSAGARACLGRNFFATEAVAVITMMISRYKIRIKEEPQFAHETFEERKERILTCRFGLSLTPLRVPLVFTLRK